MIRSDPAGDEPLPAYPANDSWVFLPPTATFELSDWEAGSTATTSPRRLVCRALAAPRASAEAQRQADAWLRTRRPTRWP